MRKFHLKSRECSVDVQILVQALCGWNSFRTAYDGEFFALSLRRSSRATSESEKIIWKKTNQAKGWHGWEKPQKSVIRQYGSEAGDVHEWSQEAKAGIAPDPGGGPMPCCSPLPIYSAQSDVCQSPVRPKSLYPTTDYIKNKIKVSWKIKQRKMCKCK